MLPVSMTINPTALTSAETFSQLLVNARAAEPCQLALAIIWLTCWFKAVTTSSMPGT